MRITFLTPSDNLTGGTRVVAMYARELQHLGHEVQVVVCAPDRPGGRRARLRLWLDRRLGRATPPPPGHIALSGVPCHTLTRHGPITEADVPDADVIVATWWETAVWMQGFGARKGRKVHLIQGYEVWFGGDTVPKVHAALRLPNVKIAISHDLKATLEQALGPLNITVIPNAIDPRQFDAPPRSRHSPPTVGFLYSTASIKGADVCIEATRRLQARLPELRLLAFGTEPEQASLPLPAGTRFELRPPQDRLRELYAACDLWLFGSRLDSFGLPVLEAMACRTPVIAVPIGAAPWLLAEGGGRLVTPESPQAMAEAAAELLEAPISVWQQASDHAHSRAHAHTWADAARQLLATLG